MASIAKRVSRVPFAPVVALLFATAIAILVAATPPWRFEKAVVATGLDRLLPLARPPLGMKARSLAVLVAFLMVGLVLWLVVRTIERMMTAIPRGRRLTTEVPETSQADTAAPAVPKRARSRPPIFADRELGAPLMSDAALATVPPIVADPELEAPLSVEEFDVPEAEEEPVMLEGETSIEALIRRLEAGLARRRNGPAGPGPDNAGSPPLTLSPDWMLTPPDDGEASNDDTEITRSAMATLQRLARR